MFTSRAEYRILLRQDNADIRLTPKGVNLGLAQPERLARLQEKTTQIASLLAKTKTLKLSPASINQTLTEINSSQIKEPQTIAQLIRRPEIGLTDLKKSNPSLADTMNQFSIEVQEQVGITLKYESYIEREKKMAEKIESLDQYLIRTDFDYDRVKALSSEGREKLKRIKPETIGQASRISGVNHQTSQCSPFTWENKWKNSLPALPASIKR